MGSEPPVSQAYVGNIDELNLDIWYSACLALDTDRGEVSIAVNGNLLSDKIPLENFDSQRPRTLQGRLHIGAWYEHSTETRHQFSGSISNIQVYSHIRLDEIHCTMSQDCKKRRILCLSVLVFLIFFRFFDRQKPFWNFCKCC